MNRNIEIEQAANETRIRIALLRKKELERLHPQSAETLRQLVKLHGAQTLIMAIRAIDQP
jgi:hypothetical protein